MDLLTDKRERIEKCVFLGLCPKLWVGAYLIFVISFTQAGFLNPKFYTQKMIKNTQKH